MERHLKPLATLKPLVVLLALTAGTAAWAADDSELKSLRREMASGTNTPAAWEHAKKMRGQWESDPEFDYLYGLLAYEEGQYNEAQFALERVTVTEPGNTRARLALAKSYYKLGDEHSALRQFEAVKQSIPPAYIMREVNHYLAEMGHSQNGSLNGFVEGGVGYDNNISSSTNSSTIANPLFDPLSVTSDPYVLLNPNSGQQSGWYDYAQAGLDYYKPLDADTGVEARGRYSNRNYFGNDRYDDNIYRGSFGVVQLIGKDQLRGTLTLQDYRLSDSDYQQYSSLSGDWTHYNFGGWSTSAAIFINELRYDEDHLRDIYQYIGNVAVQQQLGKFTQSAGILLGDEDAQHSEGEHNARTFSGLYYNIDYDLTSAHQLFGRIYYQQSEQNAQDPYFREIRNDDYQQLTMGWDWHLSTPLRLRTEVIYNSNDSDISFYSYERTRVQTGLRYSF